MFLDSSLWSFYCYLFVILSSVYPVPWSQSIPPQPDLQLHSHGRLHVPWTHPGYGKHWVQFLPTQPTLHLSENTLSERLLERICHYWSNNSYLHSFGLRQYPLSRWQPSEHTAGIKCYIGCYCDLPAQLLLSSRTRHFLLTYLT